MWKKWVVYINQRDTWLSAGHIPGHENFVAEIFGVVCKNLGRPSTDFFAARANRKCELYFSYKPDINATAVDAFSQSWRELDFYAFPPFNLIGRVLGKVPKQEASGILIVTYWPTQPLYPQLIRIVYEPPLLFSSYPRLLVLPGVKEKHPLHKSLMLMAVRLSGKRYKILEFQKTLELSSVPRGEMELKNNTKRLSNEGCDIFLQGKLIPIHHLLFRY